MLKKAFLLGVLGVSTAVSLTAQADTSKTEAAPFVTTPPSVISEWTKPAESASDLKMKNGSSTIELYGTVDIGYEHQGK